MTSRDLLQLDDDCCFPNHLRRKWQTIYGQDPLKAARQYDRGLTELFFSIALLALLLALSTSIVIYFTGLQRANDPRNLPYLIGAVVTIVPFFISGFIRLIRNREGGKAFARALSELAGFLETDVEYLNSYPFPELETRVEQNLVKIAMAILELEEANKIDAALGKRDLFKLVHCRCWSFLLVEEEWGPFFAKAKGKLCEKAPRRPLDEHEIDDVIAKLPPPGPNGGQPSAGIEALIRESEDTPVVEPRVHHPDPHHFG